MRDLEGCVLHVAVAVDDAWRLAAQLQRGGREVLRRSLGHLAPDSRRAGKDQVIEGQRCEQGCQVGIALHHAELVGGEKLRHQRCQLRRSVGREFTGFEHDPVACCQRGDGRGQRQLHRIVPRRNHAHHAQGLAGNPGRGGLQHQGRGHFLGLHPAPEVAQGVRQQAAQHKKVCHLRQQR